MKQLGLISTVFCAGLLGGGLLGTAVYAGGNDSENGNPATLKFKYIGASCETWFNAQGDQATCVEHADDMPKKVRVVAHDPENRYVWFDGIVKEKKEFTIDALNGERITFTGGSIIFDIFDLEDNRLQAIEIGTAPASLIKNDVFASLTLRKVNYKFKIPKKHEDFSQYIVSFYDDVSWDEIIAYTEYWKVYGVSVGMELPFVNALALKVPDYVLPEELADDPQVSAIEYNQPLGLNNLLNAQGNSFIRPFDHEPEEYEYPWSVLKLYDQFYDYYATDSPTGWLAEEAVPELIQFALKNLGKAKLQIAFFDTGISEQHKKANRKHKGGIDVVSPALANDGKTTFITGTPGDDNGHGTHVAGILATLLDEKHKWGEGLNAELYGVKILDHYATGELSNLTLGLQWAVDNDIDIVNMSVGYRQDSPATRKAIQEAAKAGLIIVASAGNHSNYDDSIVLQGASEGGAGKGGAGEGGASKGGAGEGGAGKGGAGEGGAGEGGAGEGGAGEGGAGEGGAGEGGAGEGGAGEGGAGEGGAGEGGAGEGGAGEGGAGEGGAGEGGAGEGGAGEGGAGEGGAGEGGAGEGGAGEGGAGEGGAGEGGAGEGGAGEGGAGEGGAAGTVTSRALLPLYSVMYPARFPEVIAVGASDPWGELAPFSNAGAEMDIMAPGVDILSWDITNGDEQEGLGSTSGTSMAAPYVTAAVALMLALDPTLDVQAIKDILRQTAHYNSGYAAVGNLNLNGALNEVMLRLLGQDPSVLDSKELEKQYKDKLKAKLKSLGW